MYSVSGSYRTIPKRKQDEATWHYQLEFPLRIKIEMGGWGCSVQQTIQLVAAVGLSLHRFCHRVASCYFSLFEPTLFNGFCKRMTRNLTLKLVF